MSMQVSDYYNSSTGKYYCEQTRSLVTGSRVKVLDGTENNSSGFRWLVSTVYYDDKYRPIQTLRDLYSTVTTDNEILSTQYDFIGKTLKTFARQVFRDNTNSVTETYLYDHADRLIQIKHQLNSASEVTLASMEYNELGQLKRKALHGQIGAGIQDLNYAYNIRGWLEKINNPEVNPLSTSTQKFNLGLYYNIAPAGLSGSPQYNGNISALAWNTPERTEALSPAFKQGYGFTYDALNRLASSVYGENTNFASSAGANNESYTYDLNGNIKSLSRYRKGTGLIDNLTYTYKNSNISNLLDKVEDASGTNGFINGVNTTNEYSFDGNGNLTADLNKGYTSILYNYLNLPKRVGTATTGQYISYIYDAAGSKLAKIGTTGTYTYYAGGFVYNGSSLSYIIHEEGHIESSGAYKYYLKDHLGSVRLIVNTTGTGGTIERQTDYYPFGMTIAEYNGSVVDYGYNGKELQDDLINTKKLDWYDYGARFYDPQIGRWTTVDPLAETSRRWSPYSYCYNNPIIFIDPDGMWPDFMPGDPDRNNKREWNPFDNDKNDTGHDPHLDFPNENESPWIKVADDEPDYSENGMRPNYIAAKDGDKKDNKDKKDKKGETSSSNVYKAGGTGTLALEYAICEALKYSFSISVSIPLTAVVTVFNVVLIGDTRQDATMELGNENYPGDWVYTKPDPTGNVPFNNPPAGFTPGGSNPESLLKWGLAYFMGYRAVKGIIDATKVQQIPGPVMTGPKEEMKFIKPDIEPYHGR